MRVQRGALHRSPFVRQHAAQALNVALTWLLYAVSGAIIGALLSFSTARASLLIMIPLAFVGWLIMVTYLVLAAITAVVGPAIAYLPLTPLRLVIGALLAIFGLQWLRKAVLRATDRKSTRLNSSHRSLSRMPSSA